jgi:hypothetical protein
MIELCVSIGTMSLTLVGMYFALCPRKQDR